MIQMFSANRGVTSPVAGYQHHDGLWFDQQKHWTYRKLSEAILSKANPSNILELGSGAGSLAWHIRDISTETFVVTVDGNPDTRKSPFIKRSHHFVARTDEPFKLKAESMWETDKFDTILSFEHFEHIHPSRFETFINNIKRHASRNALLIASAANWAYPDSDVHCNVKSMEEWRECLMGYWMQLVDMSVLTGNEPFNIEPGRTSELIFRIP